MTHGDVQLVEILEESAEDRWFSAAAGSLIGAAAADALGWITEFVRGQDHLRKLYRTDRVVEYRSWQRPPEADFKPTLTL